MNGITPLLAETAQDQRLKALRSAFQPRGDGPPDLTMLAAVAGVILGAVVVLLVVRKIWHTIAARSVYRRPYRLFSFALKRLGVDLPDRVLFRVAARRCGLQQPTVMLFSPELLERTTGRWADSLALKPLREHARRRIALLAERAFP